MKRELGIARCGLACCLCSENKKCNGCYSDTCPDYIQCENRKCAMEKELPGCYACEMDCKRGLLNKIKPYGFTLFTQTSHIKNGICSLKNQYFSSQNSAQAAAEPHSNAFCMYFGSR